MARTFDYRGPEGGFVSDSSPLTLQDNEWSDTLNTRIHNRAISKIEGETRLYAAQLATSPRSLQFIRGSGTNQFYYYVDSLGDTYRINAAGAVARVTRGLSNSNRLSVSGNLQMSVASGGNILLVNDGTRVPEYITSTGTGTRTTQLTQITNWETLTGFTNTRAGVIRPFKYVWVAGDITRTQSSDSQIIRAPGTIRISNRAQFGAIPTWNTTGAGVDTADEFELASNGAIIDMVTLNDTLVVFTEDTIYGINVSGSGGRTTGAVRSSKLLEGRGMLAANCGVEFFGQLFVVGNEDIYIFQGGSRTQSIADSRVRDYFFENLNRAHYSNTFVVHNERHDEIWLCYPKGNSEACNEALIWNYHMNCWTRRELPNVFTGVQGPTISSDTFNLSDFKPQLPDGTTRRIKTMDTGTTFDGTTFNAFVERRGVDISGDEGSDADLQIGYVLASGSGQGTFTWHTTSAPGDPVDLTNTSPRYVKQQDYRFEGVKSDFKLDLRAEGKFLNFRYDGTNDWSIHAITLTPRASSRRSR